MPQGLYLLGPGLFSVNGLVISLNPQNTRKMFDQAYRNRDSKGCGIERYDEYSDIESHKGKPKGE